MSGHTQGPWGFVGSALVALDKPVPDENSMIAAIMGASREDKRLIAAAPDMLDALQAMFDARGRDTEKVVQMCKDAISKATGVPHA